MPDDQLLAQLSAQYGLGEAYYDHRGEYRKFSNAARSAILLAMGVDLHPNAERKTTHKTLLPRVRVCCA